MAIKPIDKEKLDWDARILVDSVLKEKVEEEVIKLALVLLGNHKLRLEHSKEGFDQYTYCKHHLKKYCPVGNKTKHWRGHFREYVVHGHSRLDCYLEVIKMLGNQSSIYYPIASFRRDDEVVTRDEYDDLKRDYERLNQKLFDLEEKGE